MYIVLTADYGWWQTDRSLPTVKSIASAKWTQKQTDRRTEGRTDGQTD